MSASEISLFRGNVKRFIAENIQPEFMQWKKSEISPSLIESIWRGGLVMRGLTRGIWALRRFVVVLIH